MQGYESIFIVDPEASEDVQNGLLEKFRGIVEGNGGQIIRHAPWGRRKLAYEVKKREHGIYHLLYLSRAPAALRALETQFGYEENVLKWMSVTVEDVDAEITKFDKLVNEGSMAQQLSDR